MSPGNRLRAYLAGHVGKTFTYGELRTVYGSEQVKRALAKLCLSGLLRHEVLAIGPPRRTQYHVLGAPALIPEPNQGDIDANTDKIITAVRQLGAFTVADIRKHVPISAEHLRRRLSCYVASGELEQTRLPDRTLRYRLIDPDAWHRRHSMRIAR